jgi:hypothetical protein
MSPATTHILQQQPTTPGGSIYNPKFSAEHIMNIIKYKALQKLKKIESDVNSYFIFLFVLCYYLPF